MTTIRSYTTIEQSKVLAEVLPLESADMYYREWKRDTKDIRIAHVGTADKLDLPCWSLAALLNVVRKTIGYTIYGIKNVYISCELGDFKRIETDLYDNEVDTCVAMIEKLHKIKML